MFKHHNSAVIKITAIIVAPKLVYIYKSCSIKSNIWHNVACWKNYSQYAICDLFFFALGYPS